MYKDYSTLKELSLKYSDNEIANMFGVHKDTIAYWRKKYGIKKENNKPPYIHDYFRHIDTEEKAYILGFISADGCINKNGKSIHIYAIKEDMDILDKIKTCLGASFKPLYEKKRKEKILLELHIGSKEMVNDLIKLGVVPNKSKIIVFPKIHASLCRHYIRGLFDGDGYIGSKQFALTSGSQELLHQVNDHIEINTGKRLTFGRNNTAFRLIGGRSHKDVIDWIYKDSSIYLNRKMNNYIKFWSMS